MKLEEIRLLILRQTEEFQGALSRRRLSSGQLQAVEAMTTWAFQVREVGVLGYQSNTPYNEVTETGFRVIGSGLPADADPHQVLKLVADFCPTHLVVEVPQPTIFRWAMRNQINCMALFNQAFSALTLQQRWEHYHLSKVLNQSQIDWVGNHGLSACRSLQQIGVAGHKVIPWGWPSPAVTTKFEPKQLRSHLDPLNLIYVGSIISSKGVGDLIIAMAQLQSQGINLCLKIVGEGESARFRAQARRLQLADKIEFIQERVPNNTILPMIQEADIWVIPSRHEHPETMAAWMMNGLSSHTPVIASDHPMFANHWVHGVNALIFPAGNARALANRIERLVAQPQLYAQLSEAIPTVQKRAQLPVTWATLVERWMQSGSEDRQWLQSHALNTQRYQEMFSVNTMKRSA